jgi:hypothetical protein
MSSPTRASIDEILADHDAITDALDRAVRDAVLTHARAGNPVATWRDGKVVWISPEEILARLVSEGAALTAAAPAKAP